MLTTASERLIQFKRIAVEFGKPENKIIEAAKAWKADVVVVGARGLGAAAGLPGHFLGGTAYEIARSLPCPLLIVPQLR